MGVYFISDLHLGHAKVITFEDDFRQKLLGVSTIEEHDDEVIRRINSVVHKRDKLYILGDHGKNYEMINLINCKVIRILLGNHDSIDKVRVMCEKLNDNIEIIQCGHRYKDYWLTHIPINEHELRGRKNIHGHVHCNTIDSDRFINVCVEAVNGYPQSYESLTTDNDTGE